MQGQEITPCLTNIIQAKIGTKCDAEEKSYDALHPLIDIGKFTIHLVK